MPIGARIWLFKKGIEPIWSAPENVGGVNLTLKVDVADDPDQVTCTYIAYNTCIVSVGLAAI